MNSPIFHTTNIVGVFLSYQLLVFLRFSSLITGADYTIAHLCKLPVQGFALHGTTEA